MEGQEGNTLTFIVLDLANKKYLQLTIGWRWAGTPLTAAQTGRSPSVNLYRESWTRDGIRSALTPGKIRIHSLDDKK